MNPLMEQTLYQNLPADPPGGNPAVFDEVLEQWTGKEISQEPVDKEAKIEFVLTRHTDGKFSARITQVLAGDKEVDNYAKWLAGSFARSLAHLESIATVDDPESISESRLSL